MVPPSFDSQPSRLTSDGSEEDFVPCEKPKRPLSAYNFFFQNERLKILASTPVRAEGAPRRSHGKMGFAKMAQTIAAAWKEASQDEKESFEARARVEKARYKKDLAKWKKCVKKMTAKNESGEYSVQATARAVSRTTSSTMSENTLFMDQFYTQFQDNSVATLNDVFAVTSMQEEPSNTHSRPPQEASFQRQESQDSKPRSISEMKALHSSGAFPTAVSSWPASLSQREFLTNFQTVAAPCFQAQQFTSFETDETTVNVKTNTDPLMRGLDTLMDNIDSESLNFFVDLFKP